MILCVSARISYILLRRAGVCCFSLIGYILLTLLHPVAISFDVNARLDAD